MFPLPGLNPLGILFLLAGIQLGNVGLRFL
jgi:hypothetical protein